MKVLIINGSYHRQGMTQKLVEAFKSGLLKANPQAQVKVINLIDTRVEFCTGTSVCSKADGKPIGECVLKDGVSDILKEMLDCDRLVFATPIYWLSHTALMQRFLERCLPLLAYGSMGPKPRNPVRKGKKGLVIVSTGAPYPFNVLMGFTRHAVSILSRTLGIAGCSQVAAMKAGNMELDKRSEERFLKQAFEMGVKLGVKEDL
jgi:multimeric flavodoxin WrbA